MELILKKATGLISFLILFFVFVTVNAVNADEQKDDAKAVLKDAPRIEFKETTHDFGEVLQGAKPKYTFMFKNIGNQKLIIEKVKAG